MIEMINGPGAARGFRSRKSGETQSDSARGQPADVTSSTGSSNVNDSWLNGMS